MTKRTRKRPGKLKCAIGSYYVTMAPAPNWQRIGERQAQSARQRKIKITLPPVPWSKPMNGT